jgi:hypothetical protein
VGHPAPDRRAKAALVEIQVDEYGGGRPERMHATLFAATMRALGLDDTYGAYVDVVPRSRSPRPTRSACSGSTVAAGARSSDTSPPFEMTSSLPNGRYADGLRRLGFDRTATEFFDVHVEADAVHEQIAAVDLCGGLLATEPHLRADVLLGAATALHLDARASAHLYDAWQAQRSSLRTPVRTQDVCA